MTSPNVEVTFHSKPQSDWETIKESTDPAVGLQVDVQKLQQGRPRYRISVSGIGQNGSTRSINPGLYTTDDGKVAVRVFYGMRLAKLIDEALLLIQDDAQLAEERYKRRAASSTPGKTSAGPSPLGAGMTPEKRAAKKARHEANQAARRAADAEFRQKARGK
jgi:hypothetical protein